MRGFTVVAWLTLAAGHLAAQHAGQFEVGAFGSYTRYDAAFGLANKMGGGARLGYFFGSRVGLEAEVVFQPEYSFSAGGSSATMQPLISGGSLVFNVLAGSRLMLYALGGYSLLDFGTRAPYEFTDNALHGGAGARIFLSNRVALRVEGRGLYAPSTKSTFGSNTATHVVATAGLSVFHLGSTPKDSDKDGVFDKKDACPDTPLGASVDPRGCPIDSDQDGVPDGLDKCPNTPRGAHVDASGCPSDADADGVADGIDQCPNTPVGAQVDAKGCPIDSDADGVPDGVDQCPATPAGATVDAIGCSADADQDGVPDGIDQCPATPTGALVDVKGCPTDADLDGVPDGLDKCPNTPSGTRVDLSGCPLPAEVIRDSDRDGVLDTVDKCPNTPLGSKVDANGCIILFQPVTPGAPGAAPRPTLILRGVNFETSRSALTRQSYTILDQVAGSLVANPEIRIEIGGYTDNTGSPGFNLRLSQARAAAVRAYLAQKGVSPGRMVAKGYGATGFIAPNSTAAGRAQNRRVELHKLP
jgi:outer membrane protein OmpA-like peptidoglycan-associated protein